jgi:hypothetical protein
MNSFTYMRSEGNCVWQIQFEQATLRDRRFIGSKAVHRVMLMFQDLEASTQSARIRTGVNEMMTRFATPYVLCIDETVSWLANAMTGSHVVTFPMYILSSPDSPHPGQGLELLREPA